jgi:hypothetical protein
MPEKTTISSFDPKAGVLYIKDPIHSYISITEPSEILDSESNPPPPTERDILSSPWLQRLRRIRQTQAGYTVYPGLEHSRFQHVLGVMHLAGRMARRWYGQFVRRLDVLGRRKLSESSPEIEYVEEVFRLAGLLHDVGHGPFSHSLDVAYKNVFGDSSVTHELISNLIIERELGDKIAGIRRSPNGKFKNAIEPQMLTWLINPRKDEYTDLKYYWLRALRPIISGLFDADSLDYLSRDAYHGGLLEYGLLDIDRFVMNTFIVVGETPGDTGLYLHRNSLAALEELLLSRLQMYRACYFHKSTRAFELRAEDLLSRLIKKLDFPNPREDPGGFLAKFLYFDEYSLFGQFPSWKQSVDPELAELGQAWEKFAMRDHGLHLVQDREYRIRDRLTAKLTRRHIVDDYSEALRTSISKWKTMGDEELRRLGFNEADVRLIRLESPEEICESVLFDAPFLDVRRGTNPLNIKGIIRIYDPLHPEIADETSVQKLIARLPMLYLPLRAYVARGELSRIVQLALDDAAQETVTQPTSY